MSKEKDLKLRRVKFNHIKVLAPHCPVCKEKLGGNNSIRVLYYCSCGIWKSSPARPLEFEITSHPR